MVGISGVELPTFNVVPASVPMWGTFLLLLSVAGGLWLKNRKLTLDSEGGIRDHYAREVASLRAQVLAVQEQSDLRMANAEQRYTEAIRAADERHANCEAECSRLREEFQGLERKYHALHRATLRTFQPRDDLHPEVLAHFRSLEQEGVFLLVELGEEIGGSEDDNDGGE
jgi:hypothetical protein